MAQGLTYQNGRVFISATPITTNVLDQAFFEAITDFVEIGQVSEFPEAGSTNQSAPQNTLRGEASFKSVLVFPSFDLSWVYDADDPGQVIMRSLGTTNGCYAVRLELDDGLAGVSTPTTTYLGMQVGNVRIPGGQSTTVVLETSSLTSANQEVRVLPAPVVP